MFGVIPAAGRGLRFGEISKRYPKCILPYQNKPIIIRTIQQMVEIGCEKVYVVVNHGKEHITDLLSFYSIPEVVIVEYDEDDGVAGSVLAGVNAHKSRKDTNFLIVLSDVIFPYLNKKAYETFLNGNDILSVQKVDDYDRWCMVDNDGVFYDKPKVRPPTEYALSGMYHLTSYKKFLKCLNLKKPVYGEWQLSRLLNDYKQKVSPFKLVLFDVIDFGNIKEYLENRQVKNSRSFNDIIVHPKAIEKFSKTNAEKLYQECNYLKNVPVEVATNFPRVYSSGIRNLGYQYTMEKVMTQNLREMFVFYDNDPKLWERIIKNLFSLIREFYMLNYMGGDEKFIGNVIKKTIFRGCSAEFIKMIKDHKWSEHSKRVSFYHGDFCLSNIFYDTNSEKVVCIDPRGEPFGNFLYDYAKLYHSFVGMYDIVDTEMYVSKDVGEKKEVQLYLNGKKQISELFIRMLKEELPKDAYGDVVLLTASLFSSMIPLHNHNELNQKCFNFIHQEFVKAIKENRDPIIPERIVL